MKAININAWEIENNDGETLVFMTPEQFDFIKKCKEKTEQDIERLKKLIITLSKSIEELECNEEELKLLNNILKDDEE